MNPARLPLLALAFAIPVLAAACGSVDLVPKDKDCDEAGRPAPGECGPAATCINGEWVFTSDAFCDPCPEGRPAEGSGCSQEGLSCQYTEHGNDCGDPDQMVNLQCTSQGWVTTSPKCSPNECPDEPPVHGGECEEWSYASYCIYTVDTGCGSRTLSATCAYEAGAPVWQAQLDEACEPCEALADPASCSASPACRWLAPGCEDGPLDAAGCFPAADCTADTCLEDESCETFNVDICWNSNCEACGGDAMICVPAEA